MRAWRQCAAGSPACWRPCLAVHSHQQALRWPGHAFVACSLTLRIDSARHNAGKSASMRNRAPPCPSGPSRRLPRALPPSSPSRGKRPSAAVFAHICPYGFSAADCCCATAQRAPVGRHAPASCRMMPHISAPEPQNCSLEELHLAFIAVDREDCVLASVPRLEMLTLEYCGAGSASAGACCPCGCVACAATLPGQPQFAPATEQWCARPSGF